MRGGQIRSLELRGGAVRRGQRHGTAMAAAIREYTAERVHLASDGSWAGRSTSEAEILRLAQQMLPAHREYSPELYEEMAAMADAAGISEAEAVIVGGFTDFVDAVRALGRAAPEEDDCTSVLVPQSMGGPWFAQTWDMHATATAHVIMLDLQPDHGPAARIFTTAGCVGQIGMNEYGISIGIDNLTAADGRIGVTWPFVVREVLRQSNLEAALECILRAPLAGGHDFMLLDADGRGYNVESMPGHTAVTPMGAEALFHTNHCLDPKCRLSEAEKAPELMRSSIIRLEVAQRLLVGPVDHSSLCALLREPGTICRRAEPPLNFESSGAVIARPDTRELWAVWGVPADHPFERFLVDRHA